jgi:uncharacterized protein YjbI with pentapeptide repeats
MVLSLILGSTVIACAAMESPSADCLKAVDRSCAGADLAGRDLTDTTFVDWDFSGADLRGALLTGADFSGSNFTHARLDNVSAESATFRNATFFGASLVGARLSGSDFSDADMEGPDLRGTVMRNADMTGARLHEVNLSGSDLGGADLSGSLFARVFLDGASLDDADMRNTVFTNTALTNARWEKADFTGAVLRGEDKIPSVATMPGATICLSRSCTGSATGSSGADTSKAEVSVPAEAFTFGAFNAARFGASYGESPVVVSRGLALSYLAAFGLYPDAENLEVLLWEPAPPVDVSPGIRDVAALYAAANTAIALRRSPSGDNFDGRMRGLILSRDVTLWELTRAAPEVRSLIARLAIDSSDRALRRADADGFAERAVEDTGTGAWERTPPAFAPALEPAWGGLTRFLAASATCDPPAPASDQLESARRTQALGNGASEDQRAAARFWDDERIRTATPTGHWTFIAAEILGSRISSGELTVREAFETMSYMTIAMADALSETWEAKYRYRTARPITILEQAGEQWRSYLTNPPFPAYPSGHAAISRAAAEVLTSQLGRVSFTSDGGTESAGGNRVLNISPRSFESFDEAATEAGMSRLWGGIHVEEDFEGGAGIGKCVSGVLVKAGAR